MGNLEPVGFLAGLIVAVALFPQLIKSLRTKSTKDISITWTLVYITGALLWVIYAVANRIVPLAIFATVEFLMASTLLTLKLIYKSVSHRSETGGKLGFLTVISGETVKRYCAIGSRSS